jgi:S-adenosylmethionine hydrolase
MESSMNPIVALLTDFGTVDPFVGVMKGVILARCPSANVVDLTHAVLPQRISEAGFWLERTAPYFAEGTIFVAVVDPGVGTARSALAARAGQRIFVGPDNGVLAPALRRHEDAVVHAIDFSVLTRMGLPEPSHTFHGRDVFAPIAAELASGRLSVEQVGERRTSWEPGGFAAPAITSEGVTGEVVTVDEFGNLMTNIDEQALASFGDVSTDELRVQVRSRVLTIGRTYADAVEGAHLAVIGAFGVVEIARRNGDASKTLGIGRGERVTVRRA